MINHTLNIKNFVNKEIISRIFSVLPLSIVRKLTKTNLIIIYYHMVSDDEVLHIKHLYGFKNVKEFEDDLDHFLKSYTPISLFNLIDFIYDERMLPKNAFLMTFDDGFSEMHDIVAPILVKKGVPAVYFVNSAFIDNKSLCFQHKLSILIEHLERYESKELNEQIRQVMFKYKSENENIKSSLLKMIYSDKDVIDEITNIMDVDFNGYLSKKKPYLTSAQIKSLIKDGFAIGAHSIDHPLYELLTLEEQLYQTKESIRLIRERFSLNYGAFAFPNTDYGVSNEFFEKLSESGLVDATFGTRGIIKDKILNNFQRVSMEKPLISAERIIAIHFAKKMFNFLKGKHQIERR